MPISMYLSSSSIHTWSTDYRVLLFDFVLYLYFYQWLSDAFVKVGTGSFKLFTDQTVSKGDDKIFYHYWLQAFCFFKTARLCSNSIRASSDCFFSIFINTMHWGPKKLVTYVLLPLAHMRLVRISVEILFYYMISTR